MSKLRNAQKTTTVVFDFDGTIADSITFGLRQVNTYADQLGITPLTDDQIEGLRSKSYLEIIKEFRIPLWRVPRLLLQLKKELREHLSEISPYPGIPTMLDQIHTAGYRIAILTSNDRALVSDFVQHHQLPHIENIVSEANIFRKAYAIKRYLAMSQVLPESIVYVGDEVRDIEASRGAGVRVISVSWGFNAGSLLKSHHPDALIHRPEDLLKAVETIASSPSD